MKLFSRFKHISNIYALIFGIIYLCILGLWKKGLVLFIGALLANLILIVAEDATGINMTNALRCVNLGYVFSCGGIANYAYYLKEVKELQGWNPFEGFSKKGSAQITAM
ncbi:DUF2628 domain-containing protein [Serratia sp. L9]|uniref:DUF2628 domain-containing protein n=1 Tax=Serratia sp. L9 TaxID=3423946 RepID=UPI003D670CB2